MSTHNIINLLQPCSSVVRAPACIAEGFGFDTHNIVHNFCLARSERWLEQEVIPRQTAARLDDNGAGRWEGTALLSHLSPATQYEARYET